jgi:glycosyltransferase involved in cell wall biosynthesis
MFLHTWNVRDIRDHASESRWRRIAPVYDALFDRIVRTMDAVYVLRPDMADELRSRMPSLAARVHAFSVPVDVEMFRPFTAGEIAQERGRLEAASGVPAEARVVLFAGRLEGQKRPLAIPEVAARLASDGGEAVHVLVVGSGTLERRLRAGVDRIAPTRVHVIPPVPQAELRRLMAVSDAFLLPSAFEGLPNVVLESLACGTPVVAARGPGRIAEILTDPRLGAVVDPTPDGLAAGIRTALISGVAGVAHRRAVAERFGPAAVNEPIYADLERLAANA